MSHHLTREGFVVAGVATGEEALESVRAAPVDLVILDLMLPGMDGLEVARRLKGEAATRHIWLLILSARGEEREVIEGLEAGADDYMVKPFSPRVLVARVRALLREWPRVPKKTGTIQIHDLVINAGKRKVLVAGKSIRLTYTEFQILMLLAERPGWVFDRAQIVDAVRGDGFQVVGRAVDVQIVGLRKKLGSRGGYIETVRGVGYRLRERRPKL